jgi:hypothetical protein
MTKILIVNYRRFPIPSKSSIFDKLIFFSNFKSREGIPVETKRVQYHTRRLIRSSRPTEIFQPPQQGFFSVHAQLQLLGNMVQLLEIILLTWLGTCTKLIGGYGWIPSYRVISSPFSHKTFFFTKLCEGTPYFFSDRKFIKNCFRW